MVRIAASAIGAAPVQRRTAPTLADVPSIAGDRLGEAQQLLAHARLFDARIGAGEPQRPLGLQKLELLAAAVRAVPLVGGGKEICHWHAENLGDALQAPGRDPVGALFVFLHLLERHADEIAKLGLRQAALQAQRAHALPDLGVAGVSASSCHGGTGSANGPSGRSDRFGAKLLRRHAAIYGGSLRRIMNYDTAPAEIC